MPQLNSISSLLDNWLKVDDLTRLRYVTAFLLVGLVTVGVVKTLFYGPLSKIPGPWHTRFTSLWLKYGILTGRRMFYVHDLHQKYGPVVRIAPSEVAVNDIMAFKEIHKPGSGFTKTHFYETLPVGHKIGVFGVFAMRDLKAHALRRKLFARAFSKSFLRQNWEPLVLEKVQLAMRQIKGELQQGSCDVMKWFLLLAGDVSTHLMFGESFHTLESGELGVYDRVAELAIKTAAIEVELPLVGFILKALPLRRTREMFSANQTLLDYATVAIRKSKSNKKMNNIFSAVLGELEKTDGAALTELDVVMEAANFILAGSDTTGISLTFVIWNILLRPELKSSLLKELEVTSEVPTDAELEELPLLNAVIEESMRLRGALPNGLPRLVPQGGTTLAGYCIPEGMTVTTQAYSLHREPNAFPDPEKFDPSRYLPGGPARQSELAKSAFSAFGAGARVCLGIHLAYMEIRLATALFLKQSPRAQIAPSMRPEDMEVESFFLIKPVGHRLDVVL